MNQSEFSTVLTHLKILGCLEAGQKLNTTSEHIEISQPGTIEGIKRWWNQEHREINIKAIDEMLHKTFKIIDLICKTDMETKNQMACRILLGLEHASIGLRKLTYTYNDDKYVKSQIEVMIENTMIYKNKLINEFDIDLNTSNNLLITDI